MDFLEVPTGKKYPKSKTTVYADGCKTIVTASRTLSPNHVELDSPTYVQNKFKKQIPILDAIRVGKDQKTGKQTIYVTVAVNGKFNDIAHLNYLAPIAAAISEIAEDKLSEPEIIKNIGLDCKPFIADEPEEKHEDA
jgi:hypothetical protein